MNELTIAKRNLYATLLKIAEGDLTDNDVDIMYLLSKDEQIQGLLSTSEQTTPTMKEYSKEEYPTLEHLEDTICENAGVYGDSDDWDGYEETLIYDGKTYKVLIEHDGTYMEYGIKGMEVIFTEIKE